MSTFTTSVRIQKQRMLNMANLMRGAINADGDEWKKIHKDYLKDPKPEKKTKDDIPVANKLIQDCQEQGFKWLRTEKKPIK